MLDFTTSAAHALRMAKQKTAAVVYKPVNVALRDTCELLDEMAEAIAATTGDRPDRSATLRAMIREQYAARKLGGKKGGKK